MASPFRYYVQFFVPLLFSFLRMRKLFQFFLRFSLYHLFIFLLLHIYSFIVAIAKAPTIFRRDEKSIFSLASSIPSSAFVCLPPEPEQNRKQLETKQNILLLLVGCEVRLWRHWRAGCCHSHRLGFC